MNSPSTPPAACANTSATTTTQSRKSTPAGKSPEVGAKGPEIQEDCPWHLRAFLCYEIRDQRQQISSDATVGLVGPRGFSTVCLCFRTNPGLLHADHQPALGSLGSAVREWRVRSCLRGSTNILICCCLLLWLACWLDFSREYPALPNQPRDHPAHSLSASDSFSPGARSGSHFCLPARPAWLHWAPQAVVSHSVFGCPFAGIAQRTAPAFLGPLFWRVTSALCMVSETLI